MANLVLFFHVIVPAMRRRMRPAAERGDEFASFAYYLGLGWSR